MEQVQPQRRARVAPQFLERIFSVPESDNNALATLEKKLSENLDEFLTASKVSGEIPLSELAKKFSNSVIPEEPCFVSEQVDFLLKDVIPYSVHTGSPKFIGHMTSAIPYFLQSLSKCMVALHQNVVKIETSRAFTFVERQTLAMLHRLVYQNNETFYQKHTQLRTSTLGLQCSGGTLANIMALWIARNKFMKAQLGEHFDQCGFIEAIIASKHKNACIFVSQRGHYSLSKAVDILGIGKKQLISIPVNEHHRIDLVQLKRIYRERVQANLYPLALVGIAGTTETGHIDPLDELADFCEERQLYYHVDAAWGGATLMSEKHKHLLKGIERADSVVIDGHKQLYLPMGVGMLLLKDPEGAALIQHETQYIVRKGSHDLGRRHLEGSRPGMALLVSSALQIFGRKGYELIIDQSLELVKIFKELLDQHPDFELITAPELNILTYRFNPSQTILSQGQLNQLNVRLQKQQRENGKSFVSRTQFRHPEPNGLNTTVLRVVLANPLTKKEHLVDILEEQKELGYRLLNTPSGTNDET
jgi:putative pyridoxal-dependent aspartate 1-decarboxylase